MCVCGGGGAGKGVVHVDMETFRSESVVGVPV